MQDDAELREVINPELYADEKLLWSGKPSPRYVMRQYIDGAVTTTFVLFMLTAFVFICYISGISAFSINQVSVPIFSVLVIPAAVIILCVSYLYHQAARTVYAVTNQRALIIKPTFDGKSILAYNIISYIERKSRAGGKDDLIFASETYSPFIYTNFYANHSKSYHYRIRKIGFFGIENAREVEQLMLKTFQLKPATSNS